MSTIPAPTPRIVFRRLRSGDEDLLHALDHDDGVMRFLDWAPPPWDEQQQIAADRLQEYQQRPGYGCFAAETPAGEFLGWFALTVHDQPLVPDLKVLAR